eukprot:c20082_g1_i2.p1 GENE.c20082_g1_i2~~c20082_g1_i2.p1  ORF type:complete len:313 (-),score=71.52 c20082_g1_i2:121-1059(-)
MPRYGSFVCVCFNSQKKHTNPKKYPTGTQNVTHFFLGCKTKKLTKFLNVLISINGFFPFQKQGVTLAKFHQVFGTWITYCIENRASFTAPPNAAVESSNAQSDVVRLLFRLSLVLRRCVNFGSTCAALRGDLLLTRYFQIFQGDVRVTSDKDLWVLGALDLLDIVTASLRMSLRVHNEQMFEDLEQDHAMLNDTLTDFDKNEVIMSESDPRWRPSVVASVPNLFTLRRTNDGFKIVALRLKTLRFKAFKLNKESVRGMWAGQQHELLYLGNQNSERGSIQNLKVVLRNLVMQSCDLPVGYPIFISPLVTLVW